MKEATGDESVVFIQMYNHSWIQRVVMKIWIKRQLKYVNANAEADYSKRSGRDAPKHFVRARHLEIRRR